MASTCALLEASTMKCWGGQFGTTLAPTTVVDGINNAIALSGNGNMGCAILADHTLKCWGVYPAGLTPIAIPGLINVTALVLGGDFSSMACAVLANQTIKCWGNNNRGQLGSGEVGFSRFPTPVQVMGL